MFPDVVGVYVSLVSLWTSRAHTESAQHDPDYVHATAQLAEHAASRCVLHAAAHGPHVCPRSIWERRPRGPEDSEVRRLETAFSKPQDDADNLSPPLSQNGFTFILFCCYCFISNFKQQSPNVSKKMSNLPCPREEKKHKQRRHQKSSY